MMRRKPNSRVKTRPATDEELARFGQMSDCWSQTTRVRNVSPEFPALPAFPQTGFPHEDDSNDWAFVGNTGGMTRVMVGSFIKGGA